MSALTVTVEQGDALALLTTAGITTDTLGRYVIPAEAQPLIGFDVAWQLDEATTAAIQIIAAKGN